jgi:hypothetical protein
VVKLTEFEYIILYTLVKESQLQWVQCVHNVKDSTYEFDERITPLAEYVCTCLNNISDLDRIGPTPEALEHLAGLVGRLTKPETPELNKCLWQHLHDIQELQKLKEGQSNGTIL